MKVLDSIKVCGDCLMVIANGDYSSLAMYPETEDKRRDEIDAGLDRLAKIGHVARLDSVKDDHLSYHSCECCESQLAGSRHHCVLLGE